MSSRRWGRSSVQPDGVDDMGVPTHAMVYTGGGAVEKGGGSGRLQFQGPLRAFDGVENWCLLLYPLPEGKRFEEVRNQATEQYIQAAGRAEAMTVEIRKPGGAQWGAESVRYVIGHPHDGSPPLDVAVPLPNGDQMISGPEVFDAEEAAKLFMQYHRTSDIPSGYVLRPAEGYTFDGNIIDLRGMEA